MCDLRVISEDEQPTGWLFQLGWTDALGQTRRTQLTLAWADYNHWSASGSDEPSAVAAAVVRFWLQQRTNLPVPTRFDAAITRRRFPNADEVIPQMIGSSPD